MSESNGGENAEMIFDDEQSTDSDTELFGPQRLRKGETVLQWRTSRILLVLEQCHDSINHQVHSITDDFQTMF